MLALKERTFSVLGHLLHSWQQILAIAIASLSVFCLLSLGIAWKKRRADRLAGQPPRPFRWRRWWTSAAVCSTLLALLITSPPGLALASRGLTSLIPPDSGESADAIVVLGRGWQARRDRADLAAALWQAQRAPKIFVSGHDDAMPIGHLIEQQGVPAQAIDGEDCSRTTEENAQFTASLLQQQGVKRILLVTDAPHMPRSFLTFQSLGFEVIPHETGIPANISYKEKARLVLSEYIGLLVYGVKGRFFEREPWISLNAMPQTDKLT